MKSLSKIKGVFERASANNSNDQSSPHKSEPTRTITLRVTDQEKAQLERDAAGMSRSAYIRKQLFGEAAMPRKTRGKHPVKDYEALGRVLGLLGRSNLPNDLNALNWAVQNQVIKLDAATQCAIRDACKNIAAIRADLIKALGLKSDHMS